MTSDTPTAIERFLKAEDEGDAQALASCFRPEGVVLDEGQTHIGYQEIVSWRRAAAATYHYTATLAGEVRLGRDAYKIVKHLEGDFPGGVADLDYFFALKEDQIAALMIFQQKG
jgi:hypothetical protein